MKRTLYTSTGKCTGYDIEEYDDESNIVKSDFYSATGKLESYVEYEWVNGLMVGNKMYSADGTLKTSVTYEYDADGNIVNSIIKNH